MESQFLNHQINASNKDLDLVEEARQFQTLFEGYMEMYSDSQTVAEYLNAHEGWFCRCAHPMAVEPLENNGYTLTIGKFGAFGYDVEPKISVVLEPPKDGLYEMYSIPTPGYTSPGYEVDYDASLELSETAPESAASPVIQVCKKQGLEPPIVITKVHWQLHLSVSIQFPQFIYKLPSSLVQSTGDRLLTQIIRQISPRLTEKVQKDFHSRFELPIPPKNSRKLQRVSGTSD